jgi:hypothetical protein
MMARLAESCGRAMARPLVPHTDTQPGFRLHRPSGGSLANVDDSFSIHFPPNAVSNPILVTYTELLTPSMPLGNDRSAVRSFTLTATDANGTPVTQFNQRYTLVLSYTDAQLTAQYQAL